MLYEFEFDRRAFFTCAISVSGQFIIVPSVDKSGDVLSVYHAKTGAFVNCFAPKYNEFSEATNLQAMPHDVISASLVQDESMTCFQRSILVSLHSNAFSPLSI